MTTSTRLGLLGEARVRGRFCSLSNRKLPKAAGVSGRVEGAPAGRRVVSLTRSPGIRGTSRGPRRTQELWLVWFVTSSCASEERTVTFRVATDSPLTSTAKVISRGGAPLDRTRAIERSTPNEVRRNTGPSSSLTSKVTAAGGGRIRAS